ncbi:hypothetical protein GIS00_07225 [Nakamurella sp. YIM 132087]|uniref:Uncharacterized protein n=1 Tax=Nakamurella alba TaxID=2665158 RepID=A0A7K1FKG2_9ACTN|nr:hypothetical protein [Nakamurella alba]MTD13733.1 hypothetical protein [Nakamurella alba]
MNSTDRPETPTGLRILRKLAAGTALAAAALVLAASPAAAAPMAGGTATTGENVVRGAGSGTAEAEVDPGTGAIEVTARATGGNGLPIALPLLGSTTSAGAQGQVARSLGVVGPGTYRVTVTYQLADTSGTRTGTAASTDVRRTTVAGFDCAFECAGNQQQIRFETLPSGSTTVSTSILLTVPDGRTESVRASANVSATATATGRGSAATVTASVDGVTFELTRL